MTLTGSLNLTKGSYYPFDGCLEDFNRGSLIGDWQLIVRDFSSNVIINAQQIYDFSIVFCDEAGNPCCFADAGVLNTSVSYEACEGDPNLQALPGRNN